MHTGAQFTVEQDRGTLMRKYLRFIDAVQFKNGEISSYLLSSYQWGQTRHVSESLKLFPKCQLSALFPNSKAQSFYPTWFLKKNRNIAKIYFLCTVCGCWLHPIGHQNTPHCGPKGSPGRFFSGCQNNKSNILNK